MFQVRRFTLKVLAQIFVVCFLISLVVASIALTREKDGSTHPWGYEGGVGPAHWGEIEQEHEKHLMCREGVHQSPVDIRNAPGLKLANISSHYLPTPIRIMNNRHTIQLRYQHGSFIKLENEQFELIQFHFHHPSEHLINGNKFPMEIHLVHKTEDHEYVIIAVLVKAGKPNTTVQKLWDRIPETVNKEIIFEKDVVSASHLLPQSRRYFHYVGSLTTPPCTENVTWLILEEPIEMSKSQIEYFQKFIDHNARPVQKLHHRVIVKLE